MIKVKFLKSHPAFGYFAGEIGFLPADTVKKFGLVENGFVLVVPDEIGSATPLEEVKTNTLPADLPERERLFESGYKRIEDVKAAGDSLLEIPGISVAKMKKIAKYLEKFVFE